MCFTLASKPVVATSLASHTFFLCRFPVYGGSSDTTELPWCLDFLCRKMLTFWGERNWRGDNSTQSYMD